MATRRTAISDVTFSPYSLVTVDRHLRHGKPSRMYLTKSGAVLAEADVDRPDDVATLRAVADELDKHAADPKHSVLVTSPDQPIDG